MKPNDVIFLCVLSACSHAGLVDEGQHYFDSMSRDYDITPRGNTMLAWLIFLAAMDSCKKQMSLSNKYHLNQQRPCGVLGAYRMHGNMELSKLATEKRFGLDMHN